MDIRLLLLQNGITQVELSRELGYSDKTVSLTLSNRELTEKTKQWYISAINRIIEKRSKERDQKK